MQLGESIRTSFEEVRGHPMRSMFTLFGVVLGTLALVVVMSVLDGVQNSVLKGINDLGLDDVLYAARKTPTDRVERAKAHLSRGMRVEDTEAFEGSENIEAMSPVGETRAIVSRDQSMRRVTVYGVMPEYAEIRNRKVTKGRWFSENDVETSAPVAVIGYNLDRKLFGSEDAVGKQLTVGGRRLTIIGVGHKFDTTFVDDDDMFQEMGGVYLPWTVYRDTFGRESAISYMLGKSAGSKKSVEAEYEAVARFRQAHNGIGDTHIENVGKEIQRERGQIEIILRNWRIVFFAIAGVSLLIGGVGIFSVLKISISERLFEIGLRKSMGATDGEIFVQFLIESVTLSVVGAAIGLAGGIGVVKAIGNAFPAGLPVSLFGLAIASGFAVAVGLFAGLYPSLTASRLQPVDALRG